MVGQEARLAVGADADLVGVFLAGQLGGGHAGADLDALHRVDAHHGAGEVLIELAVDRRAPAGRHALGNDLDDGADGGAGLAYAVEIVGPGDRGCRIGAEERVGVDGLPVPQRAVDLDIPDLHQRAANGDAVDHLARHRAGGDACCRLARRRAAAAAEVAHAVLLPVGVVGVAGAELVLDVAVVLGALVDVADEERDRRAGGDRAAVFVGKDARQDLDRVGLLALGGEARLPRAALVEECLDVGSLQRQSRRAAVDDAADRRSVALAPGRHTKEVTEGVVGHRVPQRLGPAGRSGGACNLRRFDRGRWASLRSASARGQGAGGPKARDKASRRSLCGRKYCVAVRETSQGDSMRESARKRCSASHATPPLGGGPPVTDRL